MSRRPLALSVAAILLVLLSLFDFPWPYEILFPGAEEPPAALLYSGYVVGIAGLVAAIELWMLKKVELLGHHCCLCTQLPFWIIWAAFCTRGRTEGPYRSNGGS